MEMAKFFQVMEKIRLELGGDYAPTQLSVLIQCHINPEVAQTDLCKLLNLPRATISRAIARLSKDTRKQSDRSFTGRGLVEARSDDYDTRLKSVYLTPEGKRLMDHIETLIG